jgi:hypothetical protein
MPFTRLLPIAGALLACVLGCSSSDGSGATVPYFKDPSDAPAPIRTAARAVVRIQVGDEFASGSFISPDGLLLTNNHVLGVGVCPVEGCFAQLTWTFERHSPSRPPQTIYVVPKAVDVGLDMAIVQTRADGPAGAPLTTPDYLTIDSREAGGLHGAHVHVVGHPEGSLKKWTQGDVVDSKGDWIWTTAFVLPGDSGSPILDDHGHIVGIVHREPAAPDLVAQATVNESSIGTASAALIAAMSAPLPAATWSVSAAATDGDVVSHQFVYWAAHRQDANIGEAQKPVLESLAAACDAGLARNDYASPDDLTSALQPCVDAAQWIDCRSDTMAPFHVCPDSAGASTWLTRFGAVVDHWRAFNGQLALVEASFAPASLSPSMATGQEAGSRTLSQLLQAATPPLDFELAAYLAAFGILSYDATNLVDYVRGYKTAAAYALFGRDIVSAAVWLNHAHALSGSDTTTLLQALDADKTIDVGTKLYIDKILYNSGMLP